MDHRYFSHHKLQGLKPDCSCCFPDFLEKQQPLLTHSVLWDCLTLSLVKYVNEILTKCKSYSCAVTWADLSLEHARYSIPYSLKQSNWALFQESELLTREEGKAQGKAPKAKNSAPNGYISGCAYFTAGGLEQTLRALPAAFLSPA